MKNVLDKLSDYIIVIGLDGLIKHCNISVLKFLGYKINEVKDMPVEEIVDVGQEHLLFVQQVREEEFNQIKIHLKPKYKDYYLLQVDITLGEWEGEESIFLTSKEIEESLWPLREIRSFMEEIPFYICVSDINNNYTYLNQAYRDWIKIEEKKFIGATCWDVFNKEIASEVEKENLEVMTTRRANFYQKNIQIEARGIQWYEKYKIPVLDKYDRIKYIVSIGKNITLQKELEDRIDKSYMDIEEIYKLEADLNHENSSISIIEGIEDYIMKELDAEGASIWVYNKDNLELTSTFKTGIYKEVEGAIEKVIIEEKIVKEIIKNPSYEGIRDIKERENASLSPTFIERGINYIGVYNIHLNEEFLGVVVLLYKEPPKQSSIDEALIRQNCNKLGILLKNEKLASELRKQLQKRREVESELAQYLDTATNIMVILDKDGRFIKVNYAIEDILGWSKQELLNKNSQEMVHPDEVDMYLAYREDLKVNLKTNRRVINRYLNKNGEYIWLEWGIKYLSDKEVYVCTARDLTEEKKMKQQQEMYEAKLRLETVKNEFFSNMSHEFKTPLNIIISAMKLMKDSIEENESDILYKKDIKKYTYYIRQNAYRLLRLINNVMDITKIDTGYYNISLGNYNIVEIVEDITLSVAQYVEGKGVELIFDTEVEEQIMACDPDKIERIILNLLSNAIKYTNKEGKIDVDLRLREDKVLISVKDNGIGIPEEKLITIFDRFIQVDDSLNRQNEGSGIGLSLVKALVELHGGGIWAESKLGEGAEFIIELPINTLDNIQDNGNMKTIESTKVDKCHIEFSDIYSLQ